MVQLTSVCSLQGTLSQHKHYFKGVTSSCTTQKTTWISKWIHL